MTFLIILLSYFLSEEDNNHERAFNTLCDFVKTHGVSQLMKIDDDKKAFSNMDSRLNTFKRTNAYTKGDVYNICKAGFYYTSINSTFMNIFYYYSIPLRTEQLLLIQVNNFFVSTLFNLDGRHGTTKGINCFCCNIVLTTWKKGRNPWLRHARRSPKCSFIQLYMGKVYVENTVALPNGAYMVIVKLPEVSISLIILVYRLIGKLAYFVSFIVNLLG